MKQFNRGLVTTFGFQNGEGMNKQLVLCAFVFGFIGGAIATYIASDQEHLLPKGKAETKRMIVDLRRQISDELEIVE